MNLYVCTSELKTPNALVLNGLLKDESIKLKSIYFSKASGGDKGLLFKIKRLTGYGIKNLFKIYLQKIKRLRSIESKWDVSNELSQCLSKLKSSGVITLNGEDFHPFLKAVKEDKNGILLLIYFNRIIPKRFIGPTPIINVHPGLLPDYRGAQPIFWALFNNEKKLGLSVHRVDAGIDTGPIYKSYFFENTDDSIHSNLIKSSLKLRDELPNLLHQIYELELTPIDQPESKAYFSRPDASQVSTFLGMGKRYY